ncbi:MAG TPA: L,D-transpeptidase family protein [Mycobacteriales bacterium]|nr:L,D-transpeptidase family protein [Mycobacteriales bacterium]
MRTKIAIIGGTVMAALVAATVLVWPGSPAGAAVLAATGQVVTVSAPSSTSTTATVEAWSRQADGRYKRVAYFPGARIGSQGMGATSEGLSRTPTGRFRLSQPFGIKANPGVTTSYFKVDGNDVWTGSTGSVINQHRRCAPGTCPASYGSIERLSQFSGSYDYGVFIGYNAPAPYGTGAVRGKGSAFFLHVKNANPTAGCVAVAASEMVWLLRWFRSAQSPMIAIGVGSAAYNPIPRRYV